MSTDMDRQTAIARAATVAAFEASTEMYLLLGLSDDDHDQCILDLERAFKGKVRYWLEGYERQQRRQAASKAPEPTL